ncbi:hypothetical protein BJ546DRAFT_86050 [Cryomyces antarcticus]
MPVSFKMPCDPLFGRKSSIGSATSARHHRSTRDGPQLPAGVPTHFKVQLTPDTISFVSTSTLCCSNAMNCTSLVGRSPLQAQLDASSDSSPPPKPKLSPRHIHLTLATPTHPTNLSIQHPRTDSIKTRNARPPQAALPQRPSFCPARARSAEQDAVASLRQRVHSRSSCLTSHSSAGCQARAWQRIANAVLVWRAGTAWVRSVHVGFARDTIL